jgi:tRNA nucleotidyltransferase/poly(A) polymerase
MPHMAYIVPGVVYDSLLNDQGCEIQRTVEEDLRAKQAMQAPPPIVDAATAAAPVETAEIQAATHYQIDSLR